MLSDELLGIAGACVVAVAGIYYIVDVLRGRSSPHAGSWLVWSVIGILGFGASSEAGAGPGSYAAGVYVAAYTVTFLISLNPRFGKPDIDWYDWPLCGVAVVGVVLWHLGPLLGAAAASLACCPDAVGLWPTLRKAWHHRLESPGAWSADAVSDTMCLFTISDARSSPSSLRRTLVTAYGAVDGRASPAARRPEPRHHLRPVHPITHPAHPHTRSPAR